MIAERELVCPTCKKGVLRYYDKVPRLVRTKNRKAQWVSIRRFKCSMCGAVHREIPENIFPFKQYEAEIIKGVKEGFIDSSTLGFEDYPCESTMKRWRTRK